MGIGNLLLGDEGVGVHAAKALCGMALPESVAVLDVGTAFIDALPAMAGTARIIIIDAMKAGGAPGDIYHVPLAKCRRTDRIDSMHGFDVFRMLAMAQNTLPADVVLLGVEPKHIGWGTELSPRVASALPHLVREVLREIGKHTDGF